VTGETTTAGAREAGWSEGSVRRLAWLGSVDGAALDGVCLGPASVVTYGARFQAWALRLAAEGPDAVMVRVGRLEDDLAAAEDGYWTRFGSSWGARFSDCASADELAVAGRRLGEEVAGLAEPVRASLEASGMYAALRERYRELMSEVRCDVEAEAGLALAG
jgi:hypothetical protein